MDINEVRKQIDDVDEEIVKLIAKRISLIKTIAKIKASLNQSVADDSRDVELIVKWRKLSTLHGVPWELAEQILKEILVYSKKIQLNIIAENVCHSYREAVVVVGYGRMGKSLAIQMIRKGLEVVVAGRSDEKAEAMAKEVGCNAKPLDEAVSMGRYIILAVPPQAYEEKFVESIAEKLGEKIVMDILSSKSWIYSYLEELSLKHRFYYVSTHPLFGPSTPAEGQKIIVIPSRTGRDVLAEVVNFWRCLELDPVIATYEEHEKAMAVVQVLTHLHILLFQLAVEELSKDLNIDPLKFSTPTFKEFTAIVKRLDEIKDVLYEIQRSNPFSPLVYDKVVKSIQYIRGKIYGVK